MKLFRNLYSRDVTFAATAAIVIATIFLMMLDLHMVDKFVALLSAVNPDVASPDSIFYEKVIEAVHQTVLTVGISLLAGILVVFFAIFYIGKNRESLYNRAIIDPVTGLFNKAKYYEDVMSLLSEANRNCTIATVDIDGFKTVNDVFGFSRGSFILKKTAELLKLHMSESEECYHAGNDLFYLLLENTDETKAKERLRRIIDDIATALVSLDDEDFKKGMDISIYNHALSFSCGVFIVDGRVLADKASDDANTLQSSDYWDMAHSFTDNANIARKQGKNTRKNSVHLFDMAIKQQIFSEKKIEDAFLLGIERGEFLLYFQPKYYINGEKEYIGGAEALVRWQNAEMGFMPPGKFISLFEKDGNALFLDMHVAKLVCQHIREWLDKGIEVRPISINVSRQTMVSGIGFLKHLQELLFLYGIPSELIELEILESSAGGGEETIESFIKEMDRQGFRIAMDDFGSGYSSLGLLRSIPLNVLKLDKSFFDRWTIDMPEKETTIVRNVLNMAKELGIQTVAEGIEEKFQVDILKRFGCDMIQGYYFSRPLPADQFEELL